MGLNGRKAGWCGCRIKPCKHEGAVYFNGLYYVHIICKAGGWLEIADGGVGGKMVAGSGRVRLGGGRLTGAGGWLMFGRNWAFEFQQGCTGDDLYKAVELFACHELAGCGCRHGGGWLISGLSDKGVNLWSYAGRADGDKERGRGRRRMFGDGGWESIEDRLGGDGGWRGNGGRVMAGNGRVSGVGDFLNLTDVNVQKMLYEDHCHKVRIGVGLCGGVEGGLGDDG